MDVDQYELNVDSSILAHSKLGQNFVGNNLHLLLWEKIAGTELDISRIFYRR